MLGNVARRDVTGNAFVDHKGRYIRLAWATPVSSLAAVIGRRLCCRRRHRPLGRARRDGLHRCGRGVIDEHYRAQAEKLAPDDPALCEEILSFRDDEIAHRDIALAHGAEETPGYDVISALVKTGSRIAIWLSTRL
jgi:Ubiquinone biosynthesis protein COQ7